MKIEKTALEGQSVRLEPLTDTHLPGLRTAIEDGRLWELPVTFVPHPNDLDGFLSHAESAFEAGKELAFATLDKPTLNLPAVQFNIRAGALPPKDDNGVAYLKIPLNAL